ncbi:MULTISPECIES: hypothetical protein [Serratia]|uniref:hypothetical protein n=1 Tax=Serratia TaxID=613 RepID=UPI0018D9A69E|nr:hypothetical protein [Serratia marcescens]
MSEREAFLERIKYICIGHGYTEQNWNKGPHDWNYFFNMGYRAKDAREAFDEARRCE